MCWNSGPFKFEGNIKKSKNKLENEPKILSFRLDLIFVTHFSRSLKHFASFNITIKQNFIFIKKKNKKKANIRLDYHLIKS